jgi:uncharacterized protein YkwD
MLSTVTLAFALLLTGGSAAAAACAGEDTPMAVQSEAALEQSILCLINERRAAAGVGAVVPSGKLRAAAMGHSNDMVRSGYFAHTTPSGITFIDRILQTGYTKGARTWQVGENLVWGSGLLSSPSRLVTSWMQSPPHRENLLRGRFREIGLAAVRGTPVKAADLGGVTVTTEYGFRGGKTAKKRTKRSRR